MLSNYPIGLFDDEMDHPTIGVKLSARMSLARQHWRDVDDPLTLAKALVTTMTNAHDQIYVDQASVSSRTVFVDASGVSTTDFDLSGRAEVRAVPLRPRRRRERFLAGWDYDRWRAEYAPAA